MTDTSSYKKGFIGLLFILGFFSYVWILHWPVLKGVLLSGYINYEKTEGEIVEIGTKPSQWGATGRIKDAYIKYLYKVDGVPYFSNQVNFKILSLRNIDYYHSKYPLGKRVEVHYEKENPSFSVLEPDNKSLKVLQGPVLMFALTMVYLFWWLLCPRYKWCKIYL